MRPGTLVAGIYYHPEAYPPTLNAIGRLSALFEKIHIVFRPHLRGTWKYPPNVTEIPSGKHISSTDQERSSLPRKIGFFLRFTFDLWRECTKVRPSVILLYDSFALYAYRLIRVFLRFDHILWYHNHDVAELTGTRRYSIGWFACRNEQRMFGAIDLFTLPTADRLRFFPMDKFRGASFIIPNYPSVEFYRAFYRPDKRLDEIKLIFQGRIGEGHGLEEIIPLLAKPLAGRPLRLVLKGYCDETYSRKLMDIAEVHGVRDRIDRFGFTPYQEVPLVSSSCHIGIGIFSGMETMHVTLGTASNKLYEYAAVGLPVIYLDLEHFSRHLGKYPWAFKVELDTASIGETITAIIGDYPRLSAEAHESFLQELNFEKDFKAVEEFLEKEQNHK